MRRLDLDLHEAEHTLSVLEASTALATERDTLAAEQLRMAQAAFAQGEIELRELLRVQETTLAARREVERLAIERQRTVAALNQALGVTP
jgi:outer membrane protein TolC